MTQKSYPEPVVGALIFNKDGNLFLMRSHKWKDRWIIPGGHVELGETMEDALKREVKEETGMDIYDIQFLCIQETIFDEVFYKKKHFIMIDFVCRTNDYNAVLNEEAQEYRWVSVDDALGMELDPYTRVAIQKFKGMQK